jgi:hypothetical protein
MVVASRLLAVLGRVLAVEPGLFQAPPDLVNPPANCTAVRLQLLWERGVDTSQGCRKYRSDGLVSDPGCPHTLHIAPVVFLEDCTAVVV